MAETGRNKKLIASSHFSSSIADAGVRIYLLYQIVRPAVGTHPTLHSLVSLGHKADNQPSIKVSVCILPLNFCEA
jgi:hypothetical protein